MLKKLLLVIAIGMMVLSLIDCKKGEDPQPGETDLQLAKLIATWNCTSASRDGVAQDGYGSFKLMLSGTPGSEVFNYSTSGRPSLSPWPANGTWKFGNSVATEITRDTDLGVGYSVTDTQLELTFTYSGNGFSGRVSEVEGQWIFKFSK